jgi:xanthine dehydrogenase YagT iron-sulfur-binding subunit
MPQTASAQPVTLSVNGAPHTLALEPRHTLLDALRLELELTGTKRVCDMGDCGACTVLVDGRAMYACLLLAVDCAGRQVTTIEGLAGAGPPGDRGPGRDGGQEPGLDPVQRAFVEADAFQCGFCTPGQIMSLRALLNERPAPTDDEIRRAVSGNLCRCGAYQNIVEAGRRAVALAAGSDSRESGGEA